MVPKTGAGLFLCGERGERIQNRTILRIGIEEVNHPSDHAKRIHDHVEDQPKWKGDNPPEDAKKVFHLVSDALPESEGRGVAF